MLGICFFQEAFEVAVEREERELRNMLVTNQAYLRRRSRKQMALSPNRADDEGSGTATAYPETPTMVPPKTPE